MTTAVQASVIIRAFNEERHLPALLEALAGQQARPFEVIVVDSGSYDRTPVIAEAAGAQLVQIESRDFTFGYSLNVGIRRSQGSYIAIVSAHTKPLSSEWLERLIRPLDDPRTAMVYGRQLGTDDSKFSERRDFERTFGPQPRILRPPHYFANNANSAIRRELWEQHGFDEHLPGLEDVEWAQYWMAKNLHVVYEPEAPIYHIHNESWRQIQRRFYREALAAKWMGVKKRRHIPAEIVREASFLASDVLTAASQGDLPTLFDEVVRFRWNKALGTVRGLADGATMQDPRRRERMFFDRFSRAVVIQGRHRAALTDIELPEVKPGDVLIKTAYVGVCATDLEILDGSLGYYASGVAKYPIVPGHEFSGTIAMVGSNVEGLQEGDAIVAECIQSCGRCDACARENWIGCASRREVGVIGQNGAYSEYLVLPGRFVHRLPRGSDLQRAALCEPTAVVLKGLRRLEWARRRQRPANCAVVGAGPIGHLCALVLAHRGHRVTVFDADPARRRYFTGTSIRSAPGDRLEGLAEFDVLVEATGAPAALDAILHSSAAGATILLLGLPYARKEYTFEDIVAYDKTIVGSVGSSAADFGEAVSLISSLRLDPFLEKVVPLSRYDDAWELYRRRAHLKIMLDCGA
jgi:2-desacetyl-2-hydroxyethyl bacteriochlorophyllide A dehydrogenase